MGRNGWGAAIGLGSPGFPGVGMPNGLGAFWGIGDIGPLGGSCPGRGIPCEVDGLS